MQYFTEKSNPLLKKVIVAALISNLAAGNAFAQETIPNTYIDLPAPQLTSWNDINIRTLDGSTGATAKSLVYPDAVKNPGDAVAFIHWDLDNGSGRAPGLQTVTDDFDVPTNNCIMASGEIENEDLGVVLPKTCSDPQYSSKRYKLVLTSSDVPVDLAFNLGSKDIRYKGIKDPTTDGGAELAEFRATTDIGRIYRVIQKVVNDTDERIVNYTFEIGTGIGDDFQQLNYDEHGVSFEMRTLVPRAFLEGETGAPDIEVWDPKTFATFSPKVFNDGVKKGVWGFLDHLIAGFEDPQIPAAGVEKSSVIDSGTTIVDGVIGSITKNYFNVEENYNASTGESITIPGNMLGYMLPGSLLPTVIAEYRTNEIGGESDAIVAIWDGTNWRHGRAGTTPPPIPPAPWGEITDAFEIVDPIQLTQWAALPLGLEIPGELPENVRRYDSILSDDLGGINTDIFIHINDKLFNDDGSLKQQTITLRVTAHSVAAVIGGDIPGAAAPDWMADDGNGGLASNAPSILDYVAATGVPVALNDSDEVIEIAPVTLAILNNDMLDGALLDDTQKSNATIALQASATADPAVFKTTFGTITINDGTLAPARPENSITYEANFGFTGTDTFFYTADVAGQESNAAKVTITVHEAPISGAPTANNDSAVTFESTPVIIDVLTNDDMSSYLPTDVTVVVDNTPLNGSVVVTADNTVTYTPSAGYIGLDRFTYNIEDIANNAIISNSALITVRVDESVSSEQKMKSSSSGHTSGLLLLAIAGLLIGRRRYTFKQ